jgi:hypothetical protein
MLPSETTCMYIIGNYNLYTQEKIEKKENTSLPLGSHIRMRPVMRLTGPTFAPLLLSSRKRGPDETTPLSAGVADSSKKLRRSTHAALRNGQSRPLTTRRGRLKGGADVSRRTALGGGDLSGQESSAMAGSHASASSRDGRPTRA